MGGGDFHDVFRCCVDADGNIGLILNDRLDVLVCVPQPATKTFVFSWRRRVPPHEIVRIDGDCVAPRIRFELIDRSLRSRKSTTHRRTYERKY